MSWRPEEDTELKFQVVVICSTWLLNTELGFSARAVGAHNH